MTGFDPVRDGPAAAQAFASHYDEVRGYVQSRVHDPHTAEDLTSEAFLRGLRSTAVTENPAALHKKIAHDLVVNRWQSADYQRTVLVADIRDAASDVATPEERVVRAEEKTEATSRLERGLNVLGSAQREAVELGLYHDMSAGESAAVMGRTAEAVSSLRSRAFEAIRRADAAGVPAPREQLQERKVEQMATPAQDTAPAVDDDRRGPELVTSTVAGTEWVWTGRSWEAPDERREQLTQWHADDQATEAVTDATTDEDVPW